MLTHRRAGERRQRVALQSITARVASGDGYTDTWTTYATVWAAVRPAPVSGTERQVANTLQVPITHVVELDYRSDLETKHRVLYGSRRLYIRGVENQDERNITYALSCEERAE